MQRYGQKYQKCPKNGGFPFFRGKDFFQKSALLYPYGALTSCKELEKTNGKSLRYSKTSNWQTTDRGDYIGPLQINRGPIKAKIVMQVYHYFYNVSESCDDRLLLAQLMYLTPQEHLVNVTEFLFRMSKKVINLPLSK